MRLPTRTRARPSWRPGGGRERGGGARAVKHQLTSTTSRVAGTPFRCQPIELGPIFDANVLIPTMVWIVGWIIDLRDRGRIFPAALIN
jgi:hypothetical protein